MPQTLSLVINTLGFCSNLYALKGIHDPSFSNPYALGFGGQFQYLTILGLTCASITFGLKIIRYFIPGFLTGAYRVIKNIATPLEGLISVLYWSMMMLDPHLLIPDDILGIPLPLDFSLHLFPALFLWVDFLVFDLDFSRSNAHVFTIYGFAAFYFAWSWYCQSINGYWPYPFLGDFTDTMRAGFFIGCGSLCWCMYEAGAFVHSKLHKKLKQQ